MFVDSARFAVMLLRFQGGDCSQDGPDEGLFHKRGLQVERHFPQATGVSHCSGDVREWSAERKPQEAGRLHLSVRTRYSAIQ